MPPPHPPTHPTLQINLRGDAPEKGLEVWSGWFLKKIISLVIFYGN